MNNKIQHEADILYHSAEKLLAEDYDVSYNNIEYQGHGFEIVLDKTWIHVWLNILFPEPSQAIITLFKKHSKIPNYLDPFGCKQLAKKKTSNLSQVYSIIKTLIKKGGE